MEASKLQEAVQFGLSCLKIEDNLRPFQEQTVNGYLKGKDVFCSVPTGSGKSRTYEIGPFALGNYLDKCTLAENCKAIVIVIQPLIALMKEQVQKLQDRGCSAIYIGDKDVDFDGIKQGQYRYLFGSPESFLGPQRDLLLHDQLQENVKLLVIDESHCVTKL